MTLASFATLDWLVLSGYLLLLIGSSWWITRRKQKDTTDYFLAGHRVPAWVAAFSVMATSVSAATFIGAPEQAYRGNLTYLSSFVGIMIAAVVVGLLFIPAFYRHNVATVYQLLEKRYGLAAKRTSSGMFMLGRVFASGARLYIGAIAIAFILFGGTDPWLVALAIAIVVVIGIVYTFVGGIEAIVWADVIQSFVFVGAAFFSIYLLMNAIPADMGQITEALRNPAPDEGSKLTLISPELMDFSLPYTVPALIGFVLIGIGAYGTDQDLTQRMLTCRNAAAGGRSAMAGVFMTVPMALLFMIVGLLLFVFYQRPDLMGETAAAAAGEPGEGREIYLDFILAHVPAGVSGLMIAGLAAAALSSLNSELNAMSSTLTQDFYRSMRPGMSEQHYLRFGRLGVVMWGVVLGGFAVVCAFWQDHSEIPLIDFALGIMTFAYSGLVGVFLVALLTRRGSQASVLAALAVGFGAILLFNLDGLRGEQAWFNLAFPWQMTIATTLAFLTCLCGNTAASPQGQPAPTDVEPSTAGAGVAPPTQVDRP